MKEFIKGIVTIIAAITVSVFIYPIGFLYSFGYSLWLSITFKEWKAFFKFWLNLIDGLFAALGHILFSIAFALDLGWNVNGEILEDMITAKENTEFSKKNVTVSASVGKLEIDGDLNSYGKFCSKVLNVVFWQKRHAIDSWNYKKAKEKLESEYFE